MLMQLRYALVQADRKATVTEISMCYNSGMHKYPCYNSGMHKSISEHTALMALICTYIAYRFWPALNVVTFKRMLWVGKAPRVATEEEIETCLGWVLCLGLGPFIYGMGLGGQSWNGWKVNADTSFTPALHAVHSESIQTPSLFSHFVMLQLYTKIV